MSNCLGLPYNFSWLSTIRCQSARVTEVDERIRSTTTDLNESQAMLEALLPLDPDAQPARAVSKPKQRPDAAQLLPKIMSKETESICPASRLFGCAGRRVSTSFRYA